MIFQATEQGVHTADWKLIGTIHLCMDTSSQHYTSTNIPLLFKLRPLPQPQLRARTYAQTNPSARGATQLRSVLARVCSVSRQTLNTTPVP
jgi:hypothetical protein